jgi:hypothetical protein
VDIETATADEIYMLLLAAQDRLMELVNAERLTLAQDAEQMHGNARNAVAQAVVYIDQARQVLAELETRE